MDCPFVDVVFGTMRGSTDTCIGRSNIPKKKKCRLKLNNKITDTKCYKVKRLHPSHNFNWQFHDS